ncbi:MAG: 3-dehydroquinate synthase [Flammeovirgaceae bacterium]|nr:3-dehydroquinate synthase [Flammeovirgaceae bacterium]
MVIETYAGKGNTKYKIFITNKIIPSAEINKSINITSKILIITDSGIPKKYIKDLKNQIKNPKVYLHTIVQGEASKSFKTYQEIIKKLVKLKFSRTDMIIAFGGGVVGDISGFAASSYLRGVEYIQIPTTLLSQVDSSVGGKTAINIPEGKNLVGAFYNPKAVLISTRFLKTLSEKEYKSGLGEVIKYSLIDNEKLRALLQSNTAKILNRDNKILTKIIKESIKTKSKIVTRDEKEDGIRAILNFGHTFGHAIEAHTNYKKMSHGAAITLGMIIASKISFYEGFIKDHQLDNIINLIDSLGLDTNYSKYKLSVLKKYIFNDKKVADGKLNLILINEKFKAFKTSRFDQNNIKKAFI